jgi:hypothetical protein
MNGDDHTALIRNLANRLAELEEQVQSNHAEADIRIVDLEFSEKVFTWATAIGCMLLIERIWDRFF